MEYNLGSRPTVFASQEANAVARDPAFLSIGNPAFPFGFPPSNCPNWVPL